MSKLKITDILLLSVARLVDIFQDLKDPGGLYSNYYKNFYGFVPQRWERANFYALTSNLIRLKKIQKIHKNNKVSLKITSKGINHLQQKDLLKFKSFKWDKKWRILIFDIEETNRKVRDLVRKKIKNLGFGYLQKSVWISPYNIFKDFKNFAIKNNLKQKLILIEANKLSLPNKDLAKIVWPLEELQNQYEEVFNNLKNINVKNIKYKRNKKPQTEFYNIYHLFINLILSDPHLPQALLPKEWPYKKTLKLVKKIRNLI